MNLYKITFLHAAPKDTEKGVKTYLLAENDEKVYEWLSSKPKVDDSTLFNSWNDKTEENETFDIYDDEYEVIGTETFKEKMIRLKGEINDEDADFSDDYYGLTLFGWEVVEENTEHDFNHMIKLGVVQRCA